MNKSESIIKISAALSKFQTEVKNPPNSANNPFFKSKYAPLDVVINTAKELLGKYGLSYIQMPGGNGTDVTCITILMCEGEWIESDVLILKADKVTAQGAGSAITYARRYQLSAMLGLAGEEDDDGNHATGNKPTTPPKAPTINPLLATSAEISKITITAKAHNLSNIELKKVMLRELKKETFVDITKEELKKLEIAIKEVEVTE